MRSNRIKKLPITLKMSVAEMIQRRGCRNQHNSYKCKRAKLIELQEALEKHCSNLSVFKVKTYNHVSFTHTVKEM